LASILEYQGKFLSAVLLKHETKDSDVIWGRERTLLRKAQNDGRNDGCETENLEM
jgi:hypothetical protein